jgi:hypothetical protein
MYTATIAAWFSSFFEKALLRRVKPRMDIRLFKTDSLPNPGTQAPRNLGIPSNNSERLGTPEPRTGTPEPTANPGTDREPRNPSPNPGTC